jgi:imidazolonepropionase-like amidohydrolase
MPTLIRDCRVWDGSGAPAFPADVLLDGGRVRTVARTRGQLEAPGAEVIEAQGRTLMPGMVEGHAHITFIDAPRSTDIGDLPPEEHTLHAARNAKTLLDCGFTSAYSAASAKLRIDIVIRNAINAGHLPGPRLRACGPEITVTGGLGDARRMHQHRDSFAIVADGVDEVRRIARLCCREGADSIKLNISGDDLTPSAIGPTTVMSEDEVRAGCDAAKDFNRLVNAHCRASESVKRAVKHGVDVIYHCEHADKEALDMLEAAKDRIFVGPAIGLLNAVANEGTDDHNQRGKRLVVQALEAAQRCYPEMRRRGIRVLIGGDYGFERTPHGDYARDLQHFVNLLGYSPSEALVCATRIGGELMGLGHELGQVREGFLADLLLVDGDPVADLRILHDRSRILGIFQEGKAYKLDLAALAARPAQAAE